MYEVSELTASLSRRVIATVETFTEAEAYVRSMGVAVAFENDPDYPNCADALLKDGRCVAIQPAGFKL